MSEISKKFFWVSIYAIAMALLEAVVIAYLHALLQGRPDWDTLRPQPFQWPLFLAALVLMAVPSLMATWPGRRAKATSIFKAPSPRVREAEETSRAITHHQG